MKNLKHLLFLFLSCLCLFSTNGVVLAMNDTIVNNDTIVPEEIRYGQIVKGLRYDTPEF